MTFKLRNCIRITAVLIILLAITLGTAGAISRQAPSQINITSETAPAIFTGSLQPPTIATTK